MNQLIDKLPMEKSIHFLMNEFVEKKKLELIKCLKFIWRLSVHSRRPRNKNGLKRSVRSVAVKRVLFLEYLKLNCSMWLLNFFFYNIIFSLNTRLASVLHKQQSVLYCHRI